MLAVLDTSVEYAKKLSFLPEEQMFLNWQKLFSAFKRLFYVVGMALIADDAKSGQLTTIRFRPMKRESILRRQLAQDLYISVYKHENSQKPVWRILIQTGSLRET